MKFLYKKILDILFPASCIGCKAKNSLLCMECLETIPPPIQMLDDDTVSIFSYRNRIIKKTLWSLKYTGNKQAAEILAKVSYDKMLEELSDRKIFSNFCEPLLMPIPLSKKRQKERGFNQSELIARKISELDVSMSFTLAYNVLYKIKDTKSQVSIKDRKKRLQNLNGCFIVKNARTVFGRNIIIIDDVTTTGATIGEAKKTLLQAGAKKVIAFTVAH